MHMGHTRLHTCKQEAKYMQKQEICLNVVCPGYLQSNTVAQDP